MTEQVRPQVAAAGCMLGAITMLCDSFLACKKFMHELSGCCRLAADAAGTASETGRPCGRKQKAADGDALSFTPCVQKLGVENVGWHPGQAVAPTSNRCFVASRRTSGAPAKRTLPRAQLAAAEVCCHGCLVAAKRARRSKVEPGRGIEPRT